MAKPLMFTCIVFTLTTIAAIPAVAAAQQPSAFDRSGRVTVCSGPFSTKEWSYRYNRIIGDITGHRSYVLREVAYIDPFHQCNNKQTQKFRVVPNEFALNYEGDLRVEGDLCEDEPTVIFGSMRANPEFSVTNVNSYSGKAAASNVMRLLPSAFYLLGEASGNSWIKLQQKLQLLRDITLEQCGATPDSIRIEVRTDFSPAMEGVTRRRKIIGGTYEYRKAYSGIFRPHDLRVPFSHDDPDQVVFYELIAGKHQQYQARAYRYNPEQAAKGLALLALFIFAAQDGGADTSDIDPICLNYTIPYAERIALGC